MSYGICQAGLTGFKLEMTQALPNRTSRRTEMKIEMHCRSKRGLSFYLILLLFSFILLQTAISPSLSATDLMEAYTRAKEHDPVYGSVVYENKALQTKSKQGLSYLLPQIQTSGTISRYDFDTAPDIYKDYTANTYNINLRQPLINFFRFAEYRQHNILPSLGEMKLAEALQNLGIRVAEAYFNLLAAKDTLELVVEEKEAVSKQLEQAKKLFRAGAVTITEVHDAEARYHLVLFHEVEAQNNLAVKTTAFQKIVGPDPVAPSRLKDTLPLIPPEPGVLTRWIEMAKERNPTLKYFSYNIHFSEEEVKKVRAQHYPFVDLSAGYTRSNTRDYIQTNTISYSSIGLSVTLPIFSGGYVTAKTEESKARLGQAKKEYENAFSDIVQRLTEAFLGIQSSIVSINTLEIAVKSTEISLHSNQKGLLAGIRTTVDVLNAQRELYNARVKLLQTKYGYILHLIKLKAAAGILSEVDMAMVNDWFQK